MHPARVLPQAAQVDQHGSTMEELRHLGHLRNQLLGDRAGVGGAQAQRRERRDDALELERLILPSTGLPRVGPL